MQFYVHAKSLHCHRLECSVAYGKRLEGLAHSRHPPTQRAHCPTTLWLGQTHRAPALTPSQAYTMKPLTCAHNRSGWKISHAPLNMGSHYFWPIAPLCSETIIEREMLYVPINWSPPSLKLFSRVDSFNLITWVIFGRFPFTLMHVCFPIGPPTGPCGIPESPGIPGFFQNPDPRILKNLIPRFFGISRSP